MEIHQIRYFLAVVRERNFSRAADSCNVTQPALTRAIQKLEDELGGRILDRKPGRIELTELGRLMLPRLTNAFQEVADARSEAAQLRRARVNRLRLGIMCTMGPVRFVPFVKRLHEVIPNLELLVSEAKGPVTIERLQNDEIDVAIAGMPSYPAGFATRPLFRERYVAAVPDKHRLANRNEIELQDLDGEDYLERLNCEFDDQFQAQHGEWPIELNTRYSSEREDWIQAMIAAGMGCAIVPEFLPLAAGIRAVSIIEPAIYREISVLTIVGRPLSVAAKGFLEAVDQAPWMGEL
jgi:LysR family transcriptional regulator, hydrogen peroxide-inducible genes activator